MLQCHFCYYVLFCDTFQLLHKLLLKHLDNPSLVTMVDELTGTIAVHGHYREEIKIWLHQLGF